MAQTVSEIAKKLSIPRHRVEYAIRAKGVEPVNHVGLIRLFGDDATLKVADFLVNKDRRGRPVRKGASHAAE